MLDRRPNLIRIARSGLLSVCILCLLQARPIGATDAAIEREIEGFGALVSDNDRVYFEGQVLLAHDKPAASRENHTFSTWYFRSGKKYKTFYDDGDMGHHSVWDGSTCYSWRSAKNEPSKGEKTTSPTWRIGSEEMNSPSDYVLDALNGYQGLLKMFEFSNATSKAHVRIFDVRPRSNHPMSEGYPDDAIMRILFDSKTGMIAATYQELPGKMKASFKVLNHWFNGDPAVVLRPPINVDFE